MLVLLNVVHFNKTSVRFEDALDVYMRTNKEFHFFAYVKFVRTFYLQDNPNFLSRFIPPFFFTFL